MALLEASGIGKNFGETHVLKDISLDLEQGEALAIIGSSGSGKTTLLRCLNFLERPDTGVIKVNGETMWDAADPATQKESEIRKKRLHFGLVFQNFNLFPQYTALQNVMLAGELLAKERPDYRANKKAVHVQLEQQAQSTDGIVLSKAFVRTEDGVSYVYKDDNGVLKKQIVKVKENVNGGAYVLVSGGLSMDDKIAFPYSKSIKEGMKTKEGSLDTFMGYDSTSYGGLG